jgi:hypothetical protein
MKSLFFGVVLILLLGVAGFFYRNVMESAGTPEPVACTMDAKVCPDGSSVGRVGPSCAFALCPSEASLSVGVTFVLPEGYVRNNAVVSSPEDKTLVAAYEKENTNGSPHSIVVRQLGYSEDGFEADIINATFFETSGEEATSIDQFKKQDIGGRTFYSITVERFEAIVHTLYYLPRPNKDLLVFEVLERDVMDWMEPTLDVETLPEHEALRTLLMTVKDW